MTSSTSASYRRVFGHREFVALLGSQCLSVVGDQLARIAVAVLVFERTSSAFLASLTYALSYLTYLIGGPWLAAISDRRPRLSVMVVTDLLRVPLVLVMCVPDLPLWALFLAVSGVGALAPPYDAARSAVQPDLLEGDDYVLGNAVMQMLSQTAQVVGFAAGGALVAATSARSALAVDAGTFLLSAGILLANLRHRPAVQRAEDRGSLFADTAAGVRLVAGDRTLRTLLLYALIGTVAVIAPEGLAVPVAHDLGEGALLAGLLTASIPLGYLVGSLVLLRVPAPTRLRLLPWLVLTGCAPLLLTPLVSEPWLLLMLWTVAGAGGTVNLVASSAYMQHCPREFRSRAHGVANTSLSAAQGLALLVAGALAALLSPRGSVAFVAAVTLAGLLVAAQLQRSTFKDFRT